MGSHHIVSRMNDKNIKITITTPIFNFGNYTHTEKIANVEEEEEEEKPRHKYFFQRSTCISRICIPVYRQD